MVCSIISFGYNGSNSCISHVRHEPLCFVSLDGSITWGIVQSQELISTHGIVMSDICFFVLRAISHRTKHIVSRLHGDQETHQQWLGQTCVLLALEGMAPWSQSQAASIYAIAYRKIVFAIFVAEVLSRPILLLASF